MAERSWRGGESSWVDGEGRTWTRRRPRWVEEKDARRYVLRATALVAVEQSATFELEWLDHSDRKAYWNEHVAGHVEGGAGLVEPNEWAVTYYVSLWHDETGRRLVLLSESC